MNALQLAYKLIATAIGICCIVSSYAAEVVSVELNRTYKDKPIVISAWVDMAPQPNGKALFVFPGWPGIPRIELKDGTPSFLYLQAHVQLMRDELHAKGISVVTVDCPTDQWGNRGFTPTSCDDNYRASEQHANDVRALIQQIKTSKKIDYIVIMGHSYGAVSSHWLSTQLGSGEIQAAIHSSSQTIAGGGAFTQYASSMDRFNHADAKVPYVYLHHRNDLCRFTPYSFATKHAPKGQLMTVVGGNRWSDPCGKASYHSFSERTSQLAEALISYINRGEVIELIKGNED
jgi:hypothetical protein